MPAAVPTAARRETWLGPTKHNSWKYIATRDISTSLRPLSAVFTRSYANAHPAVGQSTRTELARGPWVTGGVSRVMAVRPNSIVRNNEERSWARRRIPWYRATWPTSPPRSIALSHRITYVPCRAAMTQWLLCYPRCPKRALHFSLCFL